MRNKLVGAGIVLFALFVLTGCTASANSLAGPANSAGFWLGLWHGAIASITFIISLFDNGVSVYEVHNNGGWYNFGFLLGAGVLFGGGGSTVSSRRKR